MTDATRVTKVYTEVVAPYSALGKTTQATKVYTEVVAPYSAIVKQSRMTRMYVEVIGAIPLTTHKVPIIMACA